MAQMNLYTEKTIMDLENRLVVAKGEGEGKKRTVHKSIHDIDVTL